MSVESVEIAQTRVLRENIYSRFIRNHSNKEIAIILKNQGYTTENLIAVIRSLKPFITSVNPFAPVDIDKGINATKITPEEIYP